MLSKKDYILIAEALVEAISDAYNRRNLYLQPYTRPELVACIISTLATAFEGDNYNFDRDRFYNYINQQNLPASDIKIGEIREEI